MLLQIIISNKCYELMTFNAMTQQEIKTFADKRDVVGLRVFWYNDISRMRIQDKIAKMVEHG